MMRCVRIALAALVAAGGACDKLQTPGQRAAAAARASLRRDSLARHDMQLAADSLRTRTPTGEWRLPPELKSVGGITLTPDNRLLLADAETGNVFEVDYRNGNAVKSFRLGRQPVHDDFVGIAVTGNGDVFELSRSGAIYHFSEGGDGNRVEFLKHDTKLGRACDFGGTLFDKERNALLLMCSRMKRATDSLSLYWWQLDKQDDRITEVRIPNSAGLQPAGVARDPQTGNYLLFSPNPNRVAAFSLVHDTLSLVFAAQGPSDLAGTHGAVVTRGGTLVMAHGRDGSPTLARYRWR